ncbi:unnamed protein product [Paramecium pentaurelia]|uniref:Uncharacterized protein n=1 Tax=Paramecium pentaurelia TaxID=43138 RepID=A0A8S1XPL4_9CILI|nr:unnamed protein product [Paramecium pentaurelia]
MNSKAYLLALLVTAIEKLQCLSCLDQYYPFNDECLICDSYCITFKDQSKLCTSCYQNDS